VKRSLPFTDLAFAAFLPFVAAALATSAVPRVAWADAATASKEETARLAFAEGLRLRDELHRGTDALAKFGDAYRLAPTPLTAYELGKTHMMLGRLIEAQRIFAAIGRMPPDPLQSAKGKAARDDAERLVADLDTRIPSIAVKLTGASPNDPPPRVSIDGKLVAASALATPQRVDPGEHRVVVAPARGNAQSQTVTILDGRVAVATFDLAGTGTAAPTKSGSLLPSQKTMAIIVGAAGLGGVGISLVLGASASSANSSAREQHCGDVVGGRTDTQCDFQGYLDMKNAGRTADLATALFIAGGVAVGVGAVLWITAPPAADAKRVALGVSPTSVLVRGGF
jgi:hypothetical protein